MIICVYFHAYKECVLREEGGYCTPKDPMQPVCIRLTTHYIHAHRRELQAHKHARTRARAHTNTNTHTHTVWGWGGDMGKYASTSNNR
jgi:hypothetical protein